MFQKGGKGIIYNKLPECMKKKKIISIISAMAIMFNAYTVSQNSIKNGDLVGDFTIYSTASEYSSLSRPIINKITATKSSVTVKWGRVKGAKKYRLYMASSEDTNWKELALTAKTFYKVATLKPETSYYFIVRAESGDIYSDYSECKDTITPSKTPTLRFISSTSFSAYFKVKASNISSGVQVQVKGKKGTWVTKKAYIENDELIVKGLKSNTKYYMRIRSYITDGGKKKHYSAFSKKIKFKTKKKTSLKKTTTPAAVEKSQIYMPTTKTYSKKQAKNCAKIINYLRKDKGLNRLVWDETLYQVAIERSKEITEQYSHIRPNGTSCFTISKAYDGENIVPRKNAYTALISWINSPSHYENIVFPDYTRIAVAGVYHNGLYYFVAAFGY